MTAKPFVKPGMYHFCTYFDSNYLTRGLALYESLCRHCTEPFTLWILCFDDETQDILSHLALPGVRLICQQEFEAGDEALVHAKSNRNRVEYYWTCTPSLPLYILRQNPEISLITYLDADIYFFDSPQPIFDELGAHSVLIHEHRYAPEHAYLAKVAGLYNVGWLSFRNDNYGLACLLWWRGRCIEWCYAHYEDGKFGDQLYLDEWPQRFERVAVLQHKGGGLAPWNLTQYSIEKDGKGLSVDGHSLIFFHFHGFRSLHKYVVEPANSGYRLSTIAVKSIFLPYAEMLNNIAEQQNRSFEDKGHISSNADLYRGLCEQRFLLRRPYTVAIVLWYLAGWNKTNQERVMAGFVAYQQGDMQRMRHYFVQAILHNPFVLFNIGVASLLVESIVGSTIMARYRTWRHGA